MTVKELIEELKELPQDYSVYLHNGTHPIIFVDKIFQEIVLE